MYEIIKLGTRWVLILLVNVYIGCVMPNIAFADWHDTGKPVGMPPHPPTHHSWDDPPTHQFHNHHFYDHIEAGPPSDAVPGHKIGQALLGARQGNPYDPGSVWVNEEYHGYSVIDRQEFFSHGFIIEEPGPTPEYGFVAADNADLNLFAVGGEAFYAPPFVRKAFEAWSNITVDDPHLRMGLEFREYDVDRPADGIEIQVGFVDYFPDSVARWIVRKRPGEELDMRLEFRRYHANGDKQEWYVGEDRENIPDKADVNDLETVARHEVGHIVGLNHQIDVDDIMYEQAGRGDLINLTRVVNFRSFSQDDKLGARDLYSIPIPEPSTLSLAALAFLAILCPVRQTRHSRA